MHVFTSISSNYIPKARVLARSVKQHEPRATFHLLLCDDPPTDFVLEQEDFDNIILLRDLAIENKPAWIFQHNVVELCTAVKGLGFQEIAREHGADKIVFLDPDIVVFSDLGLIRDALDEHSVLLTPHQTEPETTRGAVLDNEVASLKYGVFNLGFLAVRNCGEGMRFIQWWSDRLLDFCFDDRERGLFTDQKWVDLAPALFADLCILRDPQLNVSTWNINQRKLSGDLVSGITVDGQPLCFYHFSGLDSGAMKVMSEMYGVASPVLEALRSWYLEECEKMGQSELGDRPGRYNVYSDGEKIRPAERLLYRYREELREQFPDPFDCTGSGGYRAWYKAQGHSLENDTDDQEMLRVLQQELDTIHHSISWRMFKRLSNAYRRVGARLGLQGLLRRLSSSS